MQAAKSVEHVGTVESIEDGAVKVNILSQSACSSCHAKGACSMSEVENKTIEIKTTRSDYSIGETVNVVMLQSQGNKAVLFAYGLPFVLVISTLIICSWAGFGEGEAGLISLAVLPIYFFVIYLFKDKFKQEFSFRIQKIE